MGLARVRGPLVIGLAAVVLLTGCGVSAGYRDGGGASYVPGQRPERFTIVPDDYHVPYAGTAADGRRFFLSEELFSFRGSRSYVGLFLWNADGSFAEVKVDEVTRPDGVPPGQAVPAGAEELVAARLAELGDYVLEPIEVEPFLAEVDGVKFGWRVSRFEGEYGINIEPGDFIAYYEPWDGLDYDT
jgi:hypothetical protein